MTWLSQVPPPLRSAAWTGTGILLAGTTAWLGRTPWTSTATSAVVGLVAGLVGAGWWGLWSRYRRTAPTEDHGHLERMRAVRVAAHLERTNAEWNDRLAVLDPAFSVPLLFGAIRAVAAEGPGSFGTPTVEAVTFPEGEVVITAVVPGRPASVRLRLQRPIGVPSPRPGSAEHGWRVLSREPLATASPVPVPEEDPGMPAARRGLLLRDPSFDVDDFASYLRQLRQAIADDGGAGWLDPQGRADVAFWGAPPLAPSGAPVRWLEVELDGWYERIEVVHAGWWISLLRTAGQPEAPWLAWRLVPTERGAA